VAACLRSTTVASFRGAIEAPACSGPRSRTAVSSEAGVEDRGVLKEGRR
jgi:hypothetical protein